MTTQPERQSPPAANRGALNVNSGDMASLVDTIDHVTHRLIQEVVVDATRSQWLKRAEQFLAARPTPEDFHGNAKPEQLREQWRRLTVIAGACRGRAEVSLWQDDGLTEDVANVLREVS